MRNGARAAFGADRLEEDCRGAAEELVALEHALEHIEVVRTNLVGGAVSTAGNAVRLEQCSTAGDLQAVDHLVGPAVVCAADLDDALFAGSYARNAQRGHDGFGARAEHAEHFNVGHVLVDLACDEHLRLMQQTGYGAALV